MHIAIVRLGASSLLSADAKRSFGGAEVRAWTFAQGFARWTEHRVTLVMEPVPELTRQSKDGVEFCFLSPRRRARDRRWGWHVAWRCPMDLVAQGWRSARRRLSPRAPIWRDLCRLKCDMLMAFGVHDPTPSVVESARRMGKPSVVFLTSDDDAWQLLRPDSQLRGARKRQARGLMQASLVVAQTQFQADLVVAAGQRVVRIRNPIDTQSLGGSYCLPLRERQYALWIGRADADSKRADLCIELARRCPEVPVLAIMNPTAGHDASRWVHHQLPNLQVLPHVAWDEVEKFFRRAFVLLNTSDHEGFPNAFLQAAKYGVPILSRRVNPDQILTQAGLGFVAGGDLGQMAEMLRQIASQRDRFQYLAATARQYVDQYHDPQQRVLELDRAIQSLELAQAACT